MGKFVDLTGKKFGRLLVLKRSKRRSHGKVHWECRCSCSSVIVVPSGDLNSGHSKSCGCLKRDMTIERNMIHGLSDHEIFFIWANMMQRCYNPKHPGYAYWGGRNIRVCKRWHDVKNFIDDMYPTYKKGLSLDRVDNSKGYSKDNCRWATKMEQSTNTRAVKKIKNSLGQEFISQAEAARVLGIHSANINNALKKGRKSAGKCPQTGKRITWAYAEEEGE